MGIQFERRLVGAVERDNPPLVNNQREAFRSLSFFLSLHYIKLINNMKLIMENWKRFEKDLITESGFQRIIKTLTASVPSIGSVAFLTAANPQGTPLPPEENKARNKVLEARLREMNLGFVRIRGKFGSPEKSYLVPNISREETVGIGFEFDQESVIWGSKQEDKFVFEYIEGNTTAQRRDVVLYGEDVQGRKDYYSQERQSAGRKFYVPFFEEEYEIDEGINMPVPLSDIKDVENKQALINEINLRSQKLKLEGKTGKYYWHHRGIMNVYLKKLI